MLSRNSFKVALITLSLLAGAPQTIRRAASFLEDGPQPVALIGFVALFALGAGALFGAAFIRRGWWRWPFATVVAGAGGIVDAYQKSMGDFMSYDAFVTMMASRGDFGSALAQHGGNMALAALAAALLFAGIGLAPHTESRRSNPMRFARFVAVPGLLAIAALLFMRGGSGANGLPPPVTGTAYTLLFGYESAALASAAREPVPFAPIEPDPKADIVLIVDESVAGAYLDINNPAGVRSGLADAKTQTPIYNFGLAAAITNCSAGANAVLRYGGTRENYLDRLRRGPSIWAYAQRAGLETVYLDAQRTGGAFQNMMDEGESALIDRWEQFDDVSVLNRDHHAANRLAELLRDDRTQFILVNKIGGHFPVSDKFPDSHALYQPMLDRKSLVVSEAEADDMDGSQASWRLYRNSYRNTLLWNVGGFFDRLFDKAVIGNATIVYTSDHGQSFHERGEYSEATHCSPNPQIEEGVVPLVVIGGASGDVRSKLGLHSEQKRNATSNYRIFPTLLDLMGYRPSDIAPVYGASLFSAKADPMTFNTNFNARLGSAPQWKRIDIGDVQSPPVSDYTSPVASVQ